MEKVSEKARQPLEEISHVCDDPQHHSGLVLGPETGALVWADLFAVQPISWGQTFLATESSV